MLPYPYPDAVRGDVVRGDVVRGDVVRGDVVRGDVVRGEVVPLDLWHPYFVRIKIIIPPFTTYPYAIRFMAPYYA